MTIKTPYQGAAGPEAGQESSSADGMEGSQITSQTPGPAVPAEDPARALVIRVSATLGDGGRCLYAPGSAGGRRALECRLAELLAGGWLPDQLVDELTVNLPGSYGPGLLVTRARALTGSPPGQEVEALAAELATERRRRQLESARQFGERRARTFRVLQGGVTEGPSTDELEEDLAYTYGEDAELLAAARAGAGLVDELAAV